MSDSVVQALFYALLLVLPLSALAARRLPMSTILRYAAAWMLIFGVALAIVGLFRHTGQ